MSREKNEQRALDIVAGRVDAPAAAAPKKAGLGGLEKAGIALWLLVLLGGGLAGVYFLVLAPK